MLYRSVLVAALAVSALAISAFTLAAVVTATELKITAYEAGLDSSTETISDKEGAGLDAPAARYRVRAVASVDGSPVWAGMFRSPQMDKAACAAFLDSAKLRDSINGLTAVVREKINPDAKVGVSCEEQPAE